MEVKLSQSELESLIYCIEKELENLNKNQFSNSFQFELEELEIKLKDKLKIIRGY